jgi:predicted transcriptional regulator
MNLETIISILFGVGGIGSVVVKNYLDKQNKREDQELEVLHELKEEIRLLGERIEQLTQEKLELSIKVARLEERLLVSAKNRIKNKEDGVG